jgi:hypothetical protein
VIKQHTACEIDWQEAEQFARRRRDGCGAHLFKTRVKLLPINRLKCVLRADVTFISSHTAGASNHRVIDTRLALQRFVANSQSRRKLAYSGPRVCLLMNGRSDVSKRPSRSNLSRAESRERARAFVCICVSGAWRCRTSARVLAVSTSAARSLCPLSGDDGMRPETKRLSLAPRAFLLAAACALSYRPRLSRSPDPAPLECCCCCKNRKLRPPVPHLTFSTRRCLVAAEGQRGKFRAFRLF